MTYVVPFDDQRLSRVALDRAQSYAGLTEERVVAVSVVPRNPSYARERDWIASDESFDVQLVLERLAETVDSIAPEAEFEYVLADRYASPGTISSKIRRKARNLNATVVFVGSENAGRMLTTLRSVGHSVAADDTYDVHIVRRARATGVAVLDEHSQLFED
ncbi:universal stress protein [Haloarchaeobius litoreus]|uniref:Universal stress protein n=1 Tax=Haloarchaeobius litoreus TaxID=755306 RepID=A0ABD6DGG0_9EURY|nr:universal stress protein [Haloarchaeobius litoreus]